MSPIIWEDPYYWMRDDKRKNHRVIAHLNRENAYFHHKTRHLDTLQKTIYDEFVSHIKETDTEVPYPHGNYFYYTRTVKGSPYKIHCRRPAESGKPGGKEEVLLDVNEMAKGREYCDVQSVEISPDHAFLAFAVDYSGYETYEIFVKDCVTGQVTSILQETAGAIKWGKTHTEIFYTTVWRSE